MIIAPRIDSLTDWITAFSTALTALAAAAAGLIAWRALRRDVVRSLPVVESDMKWIKIGHAVCVELRITVRNQLLETVTLDSAKIDRPRGSVFAGARYENVTNYAGQDKLVELTRGTSKTVILNKEIEAAGTARMGATGQIQRPDIFEGVFYIWPPEGWDGGVAKVSLWLSSKALTIRDKRIARKSRLTAQTARNTDANASNAG